MAVKTIEILDPVAETRATQKAITRHVDSLNGKAVGVIFNGWRCLDPLGARFQELLSEKYKVSQFIRRNKVDPSNSAPPEVIEEIATKCNIAISALGN